MSLRCIKCDGAIGSKPGREGFHCDVCGSAFLKLRRYVMKGLEVEYCPACRHVWLDQHEIDVLVREVPPARPAKDRPIDIPPDAAEQRSRDMHEEELPHKVELFLNIIGAIGDW